MEIGIERVQVTVRMGMATFHSLPADLRLEMQFGAFKRQLKTVLFSR